MNAHPVQPGDILARKYRVERVLGAGNMGVVVAATHVDLGQVVALKHMLSGRASNPEQRERFLREARAAVRLKSHHVARVLDVGAQEDEAPYIVMEFLEGQDLDALLKAGGPRPFEEAVEYVLQACEAVGEAHAAGIVHRDLKPANLFLTLDVSGAPCVKVLDFGISKLAGAELALTNESQALGSPLYMSPEQMNSSKSVDARSDVWALGIILYQLVADVTPFHSETIQELCARVLTGQPTPLRQHRPDAPPGFEAIVLRCLERDRERRYRDVAELAAALAAYAPAHARVYAERVARVVHMKGARAGSSPDLSASPALRPSFPSAPDIPAALPASPSAFATTAQAPTQLNPVAPPPPAALQASWPTPPPAAAPEAYRPMPPPPATPEALRSTARSMPATGGDTGLALAASSAPASPSKQKQGAQTRALLISLGVLITLAIPVALYVALGRRGTTEEQTSAPSSTTSTLAAVAPATPSPAVPGPTTTGSAGAPATASPGDPALIPSATPPVSSSSALPSPAVKPSGSKPKPPPSSDLYSR